MFNINFCRWLDLNRRPLELEATCLPTEPQPLPMGKYFLRAILVRRRISPIYWYQAKKQSRIGKSNSFSFFRWYLLLCRSQRGSEGDLQRFDQQSGQAGPDGLSVTIFGDIWSFCQKNWKPFNFLRFMYIFVVVNGHRFIK